MPIEINYSKKTQNKTNTNLVFFSNHKLDIKPIKKNLSNFEYSYINDLLKTADLKKKIFVFEINSKKKIFISYDINDLNNLDSELYDEIICLNISTYLYAKKYLKVNRITKYELNDQSKKKLMIDILDSEKKINKIKSNVKIDKNYIDDNLNYYYDYFNRSRSYYKWLDHLKGNVSIKIDNKIINIDENQIVSEIIQLKFIKENKSFYNLKKLSLTKNIIIFLINRFLFFVLKNKRLIWTTSKDFAFENFLNNEINIKNFVYVGVNDISSFDKPIFKSIKTLYELCFKKKRLIEIFVPYFNQKTSPTFFFKEEIHNKEIINFFDFIYDLTVYNYNYLKNNLAKLQNQFFFGDHCRTISSLSIVYLSEIYNFNTFLFSHGSHILNENNFISNYESKHLAYRMTYHKKINFIISQSKLCTDFLKKNYVTKNILFSKPIKWKKSNNTINKNNETINILYATTIKRVNFRFWMYEDSFEFYNNIKYLVNFTKLNNKINLIIKMRTNEEFIPSIVSNSFEQNPRVNFINSGDISEYIEWSDIVLSYSSTVLEEALYSETKVGIFTPSERYFHFPKEVFKRNKNIYFFNYKNFNKKLQDLYNDLKKEKFDMANNYYYDNYKQINNFF